MSQIINQFFLKIPEPQQSALLFLRQYLIEDIGLEEHWKFNTPFYYFKNKWFCYISYSAKRKHEIYIGFIRGYKIEYPNLISEGRKQIKIWRIDPNENIDINSLKQIVLLLKKSY
jgi:hypothetical protein